MVRHPAPLDALRTEIRRLCNGGSTRIGVIGFSAGGHLAGLAALAVGRDADEAVDFAIQRGPLRCWEEMVVMTGEPLVCRFCGREFPDMRGQLPGLEDTAPKFCPARLKAGAVKIEVGESDRDVAARRVP